MKKKSNRGGKRPGAGRPKAGDTATVSIRVSTAHKERFFAQVPKHERRQWLEERIDGIKS